MTELALSLRWRIHSAGVAETARAVHATGVRAVELCGLDAAGLTAWSRQASPLGLRAVSVHAPCPDEVRGHRRYPGDWALHADPDLRAAALSAARASVRWARASGVPFVVFHVGSYDAPDLYGELAAAVAAAGSGSPAAAEARGRYRARVEAQSRARRQLLSGFVAAVLADAGDEVTVCLENRYRYDQAPRVQDVAALLAEFAGAPLAYWHDTGHEAAQRHLGVWDEPAFRAAAGALAGLHLHDCRGTDDHRPPGEGDYDFGPVLSRWRPGMPAVLELSPAASADRVRAGLAVIDAALGPGG